MRIMTSKTMIVSLRSKGFRGLGKQKKTEARDFSCFERAKNKNKKRKNGDVSNNVYLFRTIVLIFITQSG